MKFVETDLAGAFRIEPERRLDSRGYFARTFCIDELAAVGIEMHVVQESVSFNRARGTLRGLHFQREPYGEPKVVRCVRGAVFDVIVDVREGSRSRGGWYGTELSEENGVAVFVPPGFAHGFLTLVDQSELLYAMGARYVPAAAAGHRYDDEAFSIAWPFPPRVIADRDLQFPPFVR